MSERLRFAELFAGAGGLSMGLERAGWECSWHAEIAEAPRAILRHRWPDTPLYGDVTTLDGRALVAAHGPIDLLTGGSPCQDLSVAGKRAGLAGARSGLFYEQMRLWDETGADLCLWENVDGARSSNNGRDFGEVLRAFVGAAVPLPSDGWRTAGVAAGPTGVAAWRVLDAQFFGVPQRRRRIFVLGTRTGRVDPAEILSLAEGVCGDSPARGEAGEGPADDAGCGAYGTLRSNWRNNSNPTTEARSLIFDWQNSPSQGMRVDDMADALRTKATPAVVAYAIGSHAGAADAEVTNESHASGGPTGMGISEEVSHSLRAGRTQAICLTGEVTHALTHEGHDASEDGTGRGTPIVARCVTAGEGQRNDWETCTIIAEPMMANISGGVAKLDPVCGTLQAREKAGGLGGAQMQAVLHGVPRRLTPRECERLMDWPDDHTLVPDAKGKLLSDAARYKAIGNGVASVHSHWIGWRLALALTPTPEPSHD